MLEDPSQQYSSMNKAIRAFVLVAAIVPSSLVAQAKRALTPADWDHWRSIAGATLSADGKWALYSLVPQVGDGELVVRSTQGSTEYRVPRGFIGRPQMVAGGRGDSASAPAPAVFSSSSKFALALTYAPMSEFEKARREKRRPADQPKASLAIVSLADGKVTSIPRVRSFRVARDAGNFVAYLLEPSDSGAANRQARDSARAGQPQRNAATPGGTPRPVADSAGRGARREYGSRLLIRNGDTGAEQQIADVLTYSLDDSTRWVGYTVSSRANAKDGAYVVTPADGKITGLLTGHGDYKAFTFDRSATQAAFVTNKNEFGKKDARYALYYTSL